MSQTISVLRGWPQISTIKSPAQRYVVVLARRAQFFLRRFSRSVSQMKNFDDLLIVVGRVVNQNRAVKEFADLGTFSHQRPPFAESEREDRCGRAKNCQNAK